MISSFSVCCGPIPLDLPNVPVFGSDLRLCCSCVVLVVNVLLVCVGSIGGVFCFMGCLLSISDLLGVWVGIGLDVDVLLA